MSSVGHHLARVLLVLLIVFIARLPFISAGFGSDPDTWRVAVTAVRLHDTGDYSPSRFPGYPIQEYVTALFIRQGIVVVNLLSVLMSLLATVCFVGILVHIKHRDPYIAALAFAFTPVVYIASTSAIDYIWALAFVLLSWLMALYQKPLFSGIALGLAIGTRITSAMFSVPLLILIYKKNKFIKNLFYFIVPCIAIPIAAFYPLYQKYGLDFLTYTHTQERLLIAIAQATIGVFGVVGTLGIALILAWRFLYWIKRQNLAAEEGALAEKPPALLVVSIYIAIVLTIFSYLRLPVEAGYLVPLVPFILIAFSLVLSRKQFRLLCAFLIISPFVVGIPSPLEATLVKPTTAAIPLPMPRIGALQSLWLDPLQGPVLLDYQRRQRTNAIMRAAIEIVPTLPQDSVILCYGVYWGVLYYNDGKFAEDKFTKENKKSEVTRLIQSGRPVYSLPWVRECILWEFGYDIYSLGVVPLNLNTENLPQGATRSSHTTP